MSQQIVSVYTFDIRKNVTEAQLLDASARLDAILLDMPGFHYRSLTKIQGGQWQDIVYFESEAALKKADNLDDNRDFVHFMSLIDSPTVRNVKAMVRSSAYPGMQSAKKINADQYGEIA